MTIQESVLIQDPHAGRPALMQQGLESMSGLFRLGSDGKDHAAHGVSGLEQDRWGMPTAVPQPLWGTTAITSATKQTPRICPSPPRVKRGCFRTSGLPFPPAAARSRTGPLGAADGEASVQEGSEDPRGGAAIEAEEQTRAEGEKRDGEAGSKGHHHWLSLS